MKYSKITSFVIASALTLSLAGNAFAASTTTGASSGSTAMSKADSSAKNAKKTAWLSCVKSANATEKTAFNTARTLTDKAARKKAIADAKAAYKLAKNQCNSLK